MCEIILAYFIVGAVEVTPGFMQIEYMKAESGYPAAVETVVMPTEQYLSCWDILTHLTLVIARVYLYATVAELVYATDLKSVALMGLRVQLPLVA